MFNGTQKYVYIKWLQNMCSKDKQDDMVMFIQLTKYKQVVLPPYKTDTDCLLHFAVQTGENDFPSISRDGCVAPFRFWTSANYTPVNVPSSSLSYI